MATQPRPDGAIVTVTSDNPDAARKIAGLGFYGILTMGAHHQRTTMMARTRMNTEGEGGGKSGRARRFDPLEH